MSAFLMTAALFVAIPVAQRFVKAPAALAATTWALALSYFQVQFAQEARGYALMALLIISAIYCLQRHLESAHRRWLIPLTAFLACALYTHNILATYLLAFAPAWLVLPSQHSTARRLSDGAMVAGAVLLLYLPWAIYGFSSQLQIVQQGFWVTPPTELDVSHLFGSLVGVYQYEWWGLLDRWHIRLQAIRDVLGPILIIAAIMLTYRRTRKETIALVALGVFPPMLVAVWSLFRTPLLMEKSFIASAVLLPTLVMMPLGMQCSAKARPIIVICALLVLATMAGTLRDYLGEQKEDWRGAAAIVAGFPDHRRLIVFAANDGELPFDYYYHYRPDETATGAPAGFFDRDPPRTMLRVNGPDDLASLKALLDRGQYDEVVLVAAHSGWADPQTLTLDMLKQRYAHTEQFPVHLLTVFQFR
jgi:uncharacterized membrane protein